MLEGVGALLALPQQFLGAEDLFRLEELIVLERVADGVVEDLYIRRERIVADLIDALRQTGQSGFELLAIGWRHWNAGRWNRLDFGSLSGGNQQA